jgi:hypothetical protein
MFIVFAALTPVAVLLIQYGQYNWEDDDVFLCLVIAVCLWLILIAYSFKNIFRHPIRATIGFADCTLCFLQLIHIMSRW